MWGAQSAPCSKREAREELSPCHSPGGPLYEEEELRSDPRPGDKVSSHNSFDLVLNSFVGGGCGAALATCLGAGGKIHCLYMRITRSDLSSAAKRELF